MDCDGEYIVGMKLDCGGREYIVEMKLDCGGKENNL